MMKAAALLFDRINMIDVIFSAFSRDSRRCRHIIINPLYPVNPV
jgi:hypothetical protein